MILAVSMVVGLLIGAAAVFALSSGSKALPWVALGLGAVGVTMLLAGMFDILPGFGRSGLIVAGVFPGIGTALALSAVIRGHRTPLNWTALAVAATPLVFLAVFGIAELLGPPH